MVHQHVIWHGISFPLNHPSGLREVGGEHKHRVWLGFQAVLAAAPVHLSPHRLVPCSERNSAEAFPSLPRARIGQPHLSSSRHPQCCGLGGHPPSKPESPTLMGFSLFSARSLSPGAYLHLQPSWLNNRLASPENSR